MPVRKVRSPFGEDAWRVNDRAGHPEDGDKMRAVVADGVGGFFENHGVSSGPFARGLASQLVDHCESDIKTDTVDALQELAARGVAGAATMACVDLYEFKGQVVLEAAVIGDCEVAVFRPTTFGTGGRLNRRGSGGGSGRTGSGSGGRGELTVSEDGVRWLPVYKSGRGMAARNTPHQVSVTTKGIVASNYRRELRTATISLKPRDVVLIGSDGLFGDLQEAEILEHVTRTATAGRSNAARLAENLARTARRYFYQPDDITAVAGLVGDIASGWGGVG